MAGAPNMKRATLTHGDAGIAALDIDPAAGTDPGGRLGDDLLRGAKEIAEEIGVPVKKIYYFLEHKVGPPIWRADGEGLMASKSGLRCYYARLQRAAAGVGTSPAGQGKGDDGEHSTGNVEA